MTKDYKRSNEFLIIAISVLLLILIFVYCFFYFIYIDMAITAVMLIPAIALYTIIAKTSYVRSEEIRKDNEDKVSENFTNVLYSLGVCSNVEYFIQAYPDKQYVVRTTHGQPLFLFFDRDNIKRIDSLGSALYCVYFDKDLKCDIFRIA